MRIGFIGLGNMGGPMALNLIKAGGNEVCVYDVRREAAAAHLEAGATWADSPQALAAQCELVMTSLPGPQRSSRSCMAKAASHIVSVRVRFTST